MQIVKDAQGILPNTESGLTGITFYALGCLFFIFIALLEYASILMIVRMKSKFKITWSQEIMDWISIALYALGFLVFNLVYRDAYVDPSY